MSFPSTFVDLQHDVLDKARLDQDFDMARIKDWLNSAYFTALIETGWYTTSQASIPLTANATNVPVPAGIHKIEYIIPTGSTGDIWGPMQSVPFEQLLRSRAFQGGSAPTTGAPSRYSFRSSSQPTLEFWPSAIGGEVLTIYGWGLPAPMVGDAEEPIIPEPYRQVIAYGALIDAAEFQKDVLMIQTFQGGYQDWLQRFRSYKNTMGTSQPDQFVIEFARPWPHRNDTDW